MVEKRKITEKNERCVYQLLSWAHLARLSGTIVIAQPSTAKQIPLIECHGTKMFSHIKMIYFNSQRTTDKRRAARTKTITFILSVCVCVVFNSFCLTLSDHVHLPLKSSRALRTHKTHTQQIREREEKEVEERKKEKRHKIRMNTRTQLDDRWQRQCGRRRQRS